MKRKKALGQKGQTAIEYLLMLVVAGGLGLTFLKKVEGYLLTNPNSYINKYLSSYTNMLKTDPRYKRFVVPR